MVVEKMLDDNNELISVIIPVYNVEKYVERCVTSVLNQTYKNIEIILVDDGSTDESGKICDRLASENENVSVIHQNNQGLGPARNTGLNDMKGKYVAFVDSDDWIENNTYEVLYDAIIKHDCDISTCGRKIVSDEGVIKDYYCSAEGKKLNRQEAVKHYLLQKDMNMSAWDKLYKASLFDEVRFPGDHLVSEDIVPIYRVLKKSNAVYLTGQALYNYYYRAGSLSKSSFNKRLMGALSFSHSMTEMVRVDFPQLSKEADYFEADMTMGIYRMLRRSKYKGSEKTEIKNTLKKMRKSAMKNEYLSSKDKMYLFLAITGLDYIPNALYENMKKRKYNM